MFETTKHHQPPSKQSHIVFPSNVILKLPNAFPDKLQVDSCINHQLLNSNIQVLKGCLIIQGDFYSLHWITTSLYSKFPNRLIYCRKHQKKMLNLYNNNINDEKKLKASVSRCMILETLFSFRNDWTQRGRDCPRQIVVKIPHLGSWLQAQMTLIYMIDFRSSNIETQSGSAKDHSFTHQYSSVSASQQTQPSLLIDL